MVHPQPGRPRPPRRRRRRPTTTACDDADRATPGARGARLGRRADRHRLGPARHLHRRHRARRADHDVRAADRDPARLLAAGATSPPPPPPSTTSPAAGCWSTSSPARTISRPTATARATRPTATPAPRSSCSSCGSCGPRRTSPTPASTSRSPTPPSCPGPWRAAAGRIRGSTSAARPRPPSGSPPPRPTSSCSGASRSTASRSGSSGSSGSSEELGREHAAAGVRAADHDAVRDTTEQAWADAEAKVAEMAQGRRRCSAPPNPRCTAAVGQQRLLDLAARGEVLDDNLYTAPGRYGGGGAGTTWLVGSADGRRRSRCAGTRSSASPTSCSPTRRTCPRSSARATSCCRCCATDRIRWSGWRRCRRRPRGRSTDRALGQHGRAATSPRGAGDDVGAGLVQRRVGAQQGERLGVQGVVGEVGVEQLEQPGVLGAGRGAGHQHRQGRDALAQVGAGGLAGLVGVARRCRGCRRRAGRPMPTMLAVRRQGLARPRGRAAEASRRTAPRWRSASRSCRRPRRGSARAGPRRRRADGLQDLALDQPGERLGLDPDRLGAEVGGRARRPARTGSRRSGWRRGCPSGRWPTRRPRRSAASSITSSW